MAIAMFLDRIITNVTFNSIDNITTQQTVNLKVVKSGGSAQFWQWRFDLQPSFSGNSDGTESLRVFSHMASTAHDIFDMQIPQIKNVDQTLDGKDCFCND